jgi:IGR protein motif
MDFVALTFVAGDISTPEHFLKAIGRSSETKISFDTWDDLWKTNGQALKKAGLATRDRRYVAFAETVGLMSDSLDRYILWAMEHYRQGDYPSDYAHEAKPKKKIRGYGFSPLAQVGRSGRNVEQSWACSAIRQAYPVSATQISL